MKKLFILCAVLLTACGGHSPKGACVAMDTLYAPRYATHFVVLGGGDSVVLRVNNPYQGASGVSYDYTLGDAQRVVCMSSSHAAFLDTLGVGDRVVGVSAPDYYTNARFARLPDVGYDQSLNVEKIAALKPDILTAYALSSEKNPMFEKIKNFGVKTLYVADYLEDNPLARAEWVVAFGAISGQMKQSEAIFSGVEAAYNMLKDSVQRLGLAPRSVMLNSPYKGVWYLPGDSSYMVRLITDAGGRYVAAGKGDNVSHAVSTEVAYAHLLQAQVWLSPSANITTRAQMLKESELFRNVKIPIYNTTSRGGKAGGSDFWESGVLRADIVLGDLVRIMHPEILPAHKLYYYKELR
ncbi:MAG: ABC transporter substrate-binding protein [Mucinivorans sp.]